MSKAQPSPAARPYHHGDLRNSLLKAAETLMARHGNWTFTLREVARAAGVSHNAPYNHFEGKRALLAAVAVRGFAALRAELLRASQEAREAGTEEEIAALAVAYVRFGTSNEPMFRLMFSADLAAADDIELREATDTAFGVLIALTDKGVAEGLLADGGHRAHHLAAWSLVHGLTTLILDGRVDITRDDRAVAEISRILATTLLDGMKRRA